MINVEVVGAMRRVAQDCVIGSSPLVGPSDGFQVPVRPEDEVVKDGDGKHVRDPQRILSDVAPIATVKVGEGDVIQMSVGPEELVGHVVDGEGIGPSQTLLVRHDAGEVGAVQAQSADVRLQVPSGEEKVSNARMNHNGARIRNSVRLQAATLRAVQLGNFHMFRVPIQPVKLTTNPVDGQAFQSHGIVLDDGLFDSTAVDEASVNSFGVDVGKVQPLLFVVKVHSHDVTKILLKR